MSITKERLPLFFKRTSFKSVMLLQRILFPDGWCFMVVLILFDLHTQSSMIRIDLALWNKTKDILLEEEFITSIDRQKAYNL